MFVIYSYIAKTIHLIVTKLRKGSGYTLPGFLILKLNPNILDGLQKHFSKGVILISGTNGKTTTSKLITHIFTQSGLHVSTNATGANLLSGMVSSVLLHTDMFGRPSGDLGVFEVDEFTLPLVLKYVTPKVLVLLNLTRDQLDRYGETDIIFDRWKTALEKLSEKSAEVSLVYDGNQDLFHELPKVFKGNIIKFDSNSHYLHKTKLLGEFNAKNVNAAVGVFEVFGLDMSVVEKALESFTSAYGRGEFIKHKDTRFQLFLAKNPASFNHNLGLLNTEDFKDKPLFFILNDNIPDGRDVSWIYDINTSLLRDTCENKNLFVSGTRCMDMLIRLKYAGVDVSKAYFHEIPENVLHKITGGHFSDVVCLPNYSAMLNLRHTLLGRKIL